MSGGGLADALTQKKLRLQWAPSIHMPDPDRDAIVQGLWTGLRQQRPTPPGNSQDELLDVLQVQPAVGGMQITARYVFDADFASMYDKTETWQAVIELGPRGEFVRVVQWQPEP